jgi:hypothetical protein
MIVAEVRHQRYPITLYFIAAPAIFCRAGGLFGLKICFTQVEVKQP